jgi:uncharacterized OB-fold protein
MIRYVTGKPGSRKAMHILRETKAAHSLPLFDQLKWLVCKHCGERSGPSAKYCQHCAAELAPQNDDH